MLGATLGTRSRPKSRTKPRTGRNRSSLTPRRKRDSGLAGSRRNQERKQERKQEQRRRREAGAFVCTPKMGGVEEEQEKETAMRVAWRGKAVEIGGVDGGGLCAWIVRAAWVVTGAGVGFGVDERGMHIGRCVEGGDRGACVSAGGERAGTGCDGDCRRAGSGERSADCAGELEGAERFDGVGELDAERISPIQRQEDGRKCWRWWTRW